MDSKYKLNPIRLKSIILTLILVVLILFIIINFITIGIDKYHYEYLHGEALDLANNYSNNLTTARESTEVIESMLEEKLLVASKVIKTHKEEVSNEFLKEKLDFLGLDSIYYYNSEGKIIYSSDENLLNWNTYEGHPAYEFIKSQDTYFVEEIRKNEVLGSYYKFVYTKLSNGDIIQLGIRAEKVNSLLNSFKIQSILDKMRENTSAREISFINNNFKIVASTNTNIIDTYFKNRKIREYILGSKNYDERRFIEGEDVFEIYIPIYSDKQKIGTLHYVKPILFSVQITQYIRLMGIIGVVAILILLAYIIITTFKANRKLVKLAYFDSITDLPNKEYLMGHLSEVIKNDSGKKAILLINCVDFRTINLVFGYDFGDKVLKKIANKLKTIAREQNKIFRFTADKFVIYVDNYKDEFELKILIDSINSIFRNSSLIENRHIEVEISIVELNGNFKDGDQIMQDASIALKYIGRNHKNYIFFDKDMERQIEREDLIAAQLERLNCNEESENFYLEYQPIVELKTNRIIGFEALARMKTKELGVISPLEFIDIAERKNLIIPLGECIFKKACKFIKSLYMEGYDDFKIAINISGIQLLYDDFNERINQIIGKCGVKSKNLELEITESVLVENFDLINGKLKELKDKGIKISLDDFGTGYSSFARLRELNIDFVKVDKYFIDRIIDRKSHELVTGDIISMSHKIGLAVVAEGVELEIQRDYLLKNNCDFMQGYLFSRPLPEGKAIQIFKEKAEVLQKG